MNVHKETSSEYEFTVWGRGVSCALAFDGRSVHWQGDDARIANMARSILRAARQHLGDEA